MADDVEVVGLQELGRSLRLLGDNIERKYIRAAIKPASEVFRAEAKLRAPVRRDLRPIKTKRGLRMAGYLKEHIGRWIKKETAALVAYIGPTKSAFWGRFYELGTKHQPARPFLRPTFDGKKDEAAQKFADELKRQIEQDFHA